MIERLLQVIAPHYCSGCDKIGYVLCPNCKYDISDEPFSGCIVCGLACQLGICKKCCTSFERAWCVGERREALEDVINRYKFERAKASYRVLADLLDAILPQLPADTVIVPVPTVSRHIRERGYDHTLLIAKRLARLRNLKVTTPLFRKNSASQRGASKPVRLKQAKSAFGCKSKLIPGVTYLLIDDISTTGATLRYAAQTLRDSGAETVWVAVIARQPLDK